MQVPKKPSKANKSQPFSLSWITINQRLMEDNATTNFAHGACDFVYLDEHYNLHFPEGEWVSEKYIFNTFI